MIYTDKLKNHNLTYDDLVHYELACNSFVKFNDYLHTLGYNSKLRYFSSYYTYFGLSDINQVMISLNGYDVFFGVMMINYTDNDYVIHVYKHLDPGYYLHKLLPSTTIISNELLFEIFQELGVIEMNLFNFNF